VNPEYARLYRDLYERHWWWRARERLVLETIRRFLPSGEAVSILDVGCGDGLLFDRLKEFGQVQGVESDSSLVSSGNPDFERIHLGPFDDSFQTEIRFSLILMLDVIEHLPDPAGALRKAHDLLRPEGVLVVTVPAFKLLWTTHDELNKHFARYTRKSLRRLATQAGFQVARSMYFFHWIFPAKLLLRLFERLHRPRPRPPSVPPIWLNRALYLFSRGEQQLITPFGVPFGSSLLFIGGRK